MEMKTNKCFDDMPDVLTPAQVSDILGVCRNTVYKLIREKTIRCIRIGKAIRISKSDLGNFVAGK